MAINLDEQIRAYAKKSGVKEKDYEHFRELVIKGLKDMGISDESIEVDRYKELVKNGFGKKV